MPRRLDERIEIGHRVVDHALERGCVDARDLDVLGIHDVEGGEPAADRDVEPEIGQLLGEAHVIGIETTRRVDEQDRGMRSRFRVALDAE